MPPITRDLARCGNCQRWASVPEGAALPAGSLVEQIADGWQVAYPADATPPEVPAFCGACGAPMVAVDMVAHQAALPVRADAPEDIATLAAQKAAKKGPT